MKKVFIIKSTLVEKREGLTNKNVWSNVFAVETEEDARKDCIRLQKNSNNESFDKDFEFLYIYEELKLF